MKPLEQMIVLDLTHAIAGPYCTMFLADLGAKVIKVENPNNPDLIRDYTPYIGENDDQMSAAFAQYNRNKSSITLNLREPEAKNMFLELVKKVDVVVENFRPGVMERLGLDYERLKEINPKLVYCAISGFGQTGPYIKRPSFDSVGQALSGLWSINGFSDRPPVRMGTVISDFVAGLFGNIGILSAYTHVQATGKGQMVDVAQLDGSIALTWLAVINYTVDGKIDGPMGNADSFARPFESFNTKDGQVFFGGFTDKFFQYICNFFGEPEFAEIEEINSMPKRVVPSTYYGIVKPKLDDWFSQYTSDYLEKELADFVPLAPIKNIAEVIEDPQVKARDMIVEVPYPSGDLKIFGLPIKLSETPGNPVGLAPKIGEHNEEIYNQFLGYTKEKVVDLKEKGII